MAGALLNSVVDVCDTRSGFSIARSAVLYSQASGVSAALTFSVLAMALGQPRPDVDPTKRGVVRESGVLVAAFVGLLMSSVLWAVVAGTRGQLRPSLFGPPATWFTSVSTAAMMLAVATRATGSRDGALASSARLLFRGVAAFASAFVWVSITDALVRVGGRSWYSSPWWFVLWFAVTITASYLGVFVRTRLHDVALIARRALTFCICAAAVVGLGFAWVASIPPGDTQLRIGHWCVGAIPAFWAVLVFVPGSLFALVVGAFSLVLEMPYADAPAQEPEPDDIDLTRNVDDLLPPHYLPEQLDQSVELP